MNYYRYYSTQRPISPMTFPMPEGNRVMGWSNFDERTFIEKLDGVGRKAWGYLDYEKPLTESEMRAYELCEPGPFYMNRETGEIVSRQIMLKQFREDYDGEDDTNSLGWEEYFIEQ